jgi:hypothetical protein
VFVFNISRAVVVPVNAVKKSRNVGQVFLMEDVLVFPWIFVIVLSVKFQTLVVRRHHIFRVYVHNVNGFGMVGIMLVFAKTLDFVRLNESDWEVF